MAEFMLSVNQVQICEICIPSEKSLLSTYALDTDVDVSEAGRHEQNQNPPAYDDDEGVWEGPCTSQALLEPLFFALVLRPCSCWHPPYLVRACVSRPLGWCFGCKERDTHDTTTLQVPYCKSEEALLPVLHTREPTPWKKELRWDDGRGSLRPLPWETSMGSQGTSHHHVDHQPRCLPSFLISSHFSLAVSLAFLLMQ